MPDPYDNCARCGSWHYTHATGTTAKFAGCKQFVPKSVEGCRTPAPVFAAPELCRAVMLSAAYELWDILDDNRSPHGRRSQFLWAATLGDYISAADFLCGFKVTT